MGATAAGDAAPTATAAPIIRVETGHHQAFINRLIALDEKRLLTVSDDQTARSWDRNGRPLAVVRGRVGPRDEGALYAAAVSSRYVALGGRAGAAEGAPFVRLLDRSTLKPAGLLASLPDVVTALAFSSDGQKLAVGFAKSGVRIYQLGKGAPLAELPAGSEAANDLLFLPDGGLVVSSGQVDLYDPHFAKVRRLALPEGFSPWGLALSRGGGRLAIGSRQQPRAAIIDLSGNPVRSCGIGAAAGTAPVVSWSDDDRLLIGGRDEQGGRLALCSADGRALSSAATGPAPVTAVSARSRELHFADSEGAWGSWDEGRPQFHSQPVKLRFRTAGSPALSVSRDGRQVTLISDGKPFALLDLAARRVSRATAGAAAPPPAKPAEIQGLEPGERVFAQAAAPGGDTFVGTSYYLRRVGRSGRTAWKAPVAAPAWGVAVAGESGLVVTALGDGTLGWHDPGTGAVRLNAYVSPQLDWAAWTPEGFFDRSGSGATLIGHAVDRGARDGSLFVPLEQTSRRYFRSDLIQAALRGAPGDDQMLARARSTLGAAGPRLASGSPPEVAIVSVCGVERQTDRAIACFEGDALSGGLRAAQLVSFDKIDITIAMRSGEGKAGATQVKVAGIATTPIGEQTISDGATERRRFRVPLPPGDPEVKISVAAANGVAASRPATIRIAGVPQPRGAATARLHILAIGISDYQLSTFDLGDGIASNDAKALAATLASTRNLAYPGATPTILTDASATATAIRAAMEELAGKASLDDLVIVFIAGHGQQVDGDYAFAPYEIGFASRGAAETRLRSGQAFSDQVMNDMFRKEGIGQEDLSAFLGRVRARRVVVVLDTCFAGSFNTLTSGQRDSITSSLGERFAESSGRYVLASSRGLALDNPAKGASNSIFTSSVLSGVNGEADRDGDRIVTLAELGDYVRREVPASAARMRVEQTPVISFFGDPYFPLYKLNEGARR